MISEKFSQQIKGDNMNRYAVIAIFVTIMVLALGGMHTHLMDLKKAKMAEKKKVKVERVKQEVEEEVVEEDLELDFSADNEEVEDVIEEQSVEEHLKKVEAPKVQVKKTVEEKKVQKPEKVLKKIFKNDKPLIFKEKVLCELSEDNKFWISLDSEKGKHTLSGQRNFYVEQQDVVVTKYLGTPNTKHDYTNFKIASPSGDKMNWGYAFLTCFDSKLNLPTKQQFNLIYQAKKNGCDMGFLDDEYWINTETPNKASVCSMATGQCREVDLVETMKTELHRVRCVD